MAFQPVVLNDDILTLGIASFAEPLAECGYTARRGIGGPLVDEPDDRHPRLLRARRERPRHRRAEKGDELAPLQSIELHLLSISEGIGSSITDRRGAS